MRAFLVIAAFIFGLCLFGQTNIASATEIKGIGGKCLDATAVSSANGTRIQLWDCWGGPNQQWSFNSDGSIRGIGGKCLDAAGVSSANGTPIQLWDCWGGPNQQWSSNSDGSIRGIGGKCLDATGVSSANGTLIQLWDCWGGPNQNWTAPLSYYSWNQYQGFPTVMIPVTMGICFLQGVTGNFRGAGEAVWIRNNGSSWELNGSSQQQSVSARAMCVPFSAISGADQGISYLSGTAFASVQNRPECSWWESCNPSASDFLDLWGRPNSFCYLTGMNGAFNGGGEVISVNAWAPDHWYMLVTTQTWSGFIKGEAGCMSLNGHPVLKTTNVAYRYRWRQGDAPQQLPNSDQAFCAFNWIQGHFAGAGETVEISHNPDNTQWLGGSSQQRDVGADVSCVYYDQTSAFARHNGPNELSKSEIATGSESKLVNAINSSDASAVADLYADDAILVLPSGQLMRGRRAIRTFWNHVLAEGPVEFTLKSLNDSERETEIIEINYTIKRLSGTTEQKADSGKIVKISRRQADGSQLVHFEKWTGADFVRGGESAKTTFTNSASGTAAMSK